MAKEPWYSVFSGALSSTYLLVCWSGLYFGIKYYETLQKQREEALQASALAQEAQVKMLRYQLNPHFMFNTLNAISTLILDGQGKVANQAIGRLSDFLRYTLDQDPMKKVTLRQELDALNLYLGIEQLRFGDRLRLEFEVDEAAYPGLVPSLILQPLVENALKYAVAPREEGGRLRIIARLESGHLEARRGGRRARPARGRRTRHGPRRRLPQHARTAGRAVRRAPDARRALLAPGTAHRNHATLREGRATMTIRAIIVDDEPLARRGLELRLQRRARHRDRAPVRERPRGPRRDRRAAARPDVPRHPDAGPLGLRRAGAGAAGEPADDRVRHRLRPLRDRRVRGARARLPVEAGGRFAARTRARTGAGAVAAAPGARAARAADGDARRPERPGPDRARVPRVAVRPAGTAVRDDVADPRGPRDPAARRRDASTGSTRPATTCACTRPGRRTCCALR